MERQLEPQPQLPEKRLWVDSVEEDDEEEVGVGLLARSSRHPTIGVGTTPTSITTTSSSELEPVPATAPTNGTSSEHFDQEEKEEEAATADDSHRNEEVGDENEEGKVVKGVGDGIGNSVYFDKLQDANLDLIGEIEEDLMELNVEKVLEKQNTHDLYCPNCNSCITRRVILRRRKPQISSIHRKPKRVKKLDPIPNSASDGRGGGTPEIYSNVSLTPAADEQNNGAEQDQEAFSCLSCFSLFIPIGNGCFKIFQFFRQGRLNEPTQSPQEISQREITESPQEIGQRQNIQSPQGINPIENTQSPQEISQIENAQSPQEIGERENIQSPQGISLIENTQSPREISQSENTRSPQEIGQRENIQSPLGINPIENIQSPQEISRKEKTQSLQGISQNENIETPQKVSYNEDTQSPQKRSRNENRHSPQEISQRENTESPQEIGQRQNIQSPQGINPIENTQTPQEISQRENTQSPQEIGEREDIQNSQGISPIENTQSPREISQRENTQSPQEIDQRENIQSPQGINPIENIQSPQEISRKEKTQSLQGISQNENIETPQDVSHNEDTQSPQKRSGNENRHRPQLINRNEDAQNPQNISSNEDRQSPQKISRNESTQSPQDINQNGSKQIPQKIPTAKTNWIFSIFAFHKGQATVEKAGHASIVQSAAVPTPSVTNGEHIDGAAIKSKEPGISNIFSSTNSSRLYKVKAESMEEADADMFKRNAGDNEIEDIEAGLLEPTLYPRTQVAPSSQGITQNESRGADAGEAYEWEILKSIVYGGLIESITSLGVVSSAAGAGADTVNVLALGLANLIGGLPIISHNLRELKKDQPRGASTEINTEEDRYQVLLGRRQSFALHVTVAILSFFIFGLVPPVVYGFSFRQSDDKDLKLAAVAGASLVCIILLALGKGHFRKPHRTYFRTVLYYVAMGIMASGISYLVGQLIKKLLEQLGLFESSSAVSVPFFETIPLEVGRASY